MVRVAVALVLGAGMAWAFQGKPVNDECPVKGTEIKPGITSVFNGKTVGFCCNNCKSIFDGDPTRFASKVGPQPRVALNSIGDALKAAKEGSKPAMVLFMDAGAKSKMWTESLADKDLDEAFGKVSYAAVLFEKGSDEAKKYGVTSAPVLVLIDPAEGKALKTLTSVAPKTVKTEIDAAASSLVDLAREWGPDADPDSLAKRVAQRIHQTCVCVYGAGPTSPVAMRWKTQINENAKVPAFWAELPEADHNEIVGWDAARELGRFGVVLLEDPRANPRNRLRTELTGELAERGAALPPLEPGRAPAGVAPPAYGDLSASTDHPTENR